MLPEFELPPMSFDLALLAGRALFLVFCFALAAICFTRWRRAADRGTQSLSEQLTALLERLPALEQQVAAANARLAELSERMEGELHRTSAGNTTPGYQIAIRLARNGADSDELMRSCGLTRQEAELAQRLHAPSRKPSHLRSVVSG